MRGHDAVVSEPSQQPPHRDAAARRARPVAELTPFELRRYVGDGATARELATAAAAFEGGWALERQELGHWRMVGYTRASMPVESWLSAGLLPGG